MRGESFFHGAANPTSMVTKVVDVIIINSQ